jgi:hypothetical protein
MLLPSFNSLRLSSILSSSLFWILLSTRTLTRPFLHLLSISFYLAGLDPIQSCRCQRSFTRLKSSSRSPSMRLSHPSRAIIQVERGNTSACKVMSRSDSSTSLSSADSSYIIKWNRLYRGSEHEFSVSAFHRLCDNQGPTVVLVRAGNGRVAAGYSCVSWMSGSGTTVPNPRGFFCAINSNNLSIKLINCVSDQCKLNRRNDCGPFFEGVFVINDKCDKNLFSNSSNSGFMNYQDPHALFGSQYFAVVEYEVFGIEILVAA